MLLFCDIELMIRMCCEENGQPCAWETEEENLKTVRCIPKIKEEKED